MVHGDRLGRVANAQADCQARVRVGRCPWWAIRPQNEYRPTFVRDALPGQGRIGNTGYVYSARGPHLPTPPILPRQHSAYARHRREHGQEQPDRVCGQSRRRQQPNGQRLRQWQRSAHARLLWRCGSIPATDTVVLEPATTDKRWRSGRLGRTANFPPYAVAIAPEFEPSGREPILAARKTIFPTGQTVLTTELESREALLATDHASLQPKQLR